MKQTVDEFKKFIIKGNVLDLAVAVMVGGAFNKIVTSLTTDILTPLIALLFSFSNNVPGGFRVVDITTLELWGIKYGSFLRTVLDFLITALIIFLLLKAVTKLTELATRRGRKKKEEEAPKPAEPTEIELLKDIRNLLKKQTKS